MTNPARSVLPAIASIAAAIVCVPGVAFAAPNTPEIRTAAANRVPACVTPDRLMSFLKTRNANPDPRFKDIARWYKHYGEAWRVRWDYAFFQMAIETNFLTYRAPNGRMGDVDPKQNNFAGIGTIGGGVPGDRYPDVKTGVLAQIQHLVAYSGERLAAPVAPRTQLKQDDIVALSLRLARPVRFGDLARRWAVDKNYGSSIEWVADQYRSKFCKPGDAAPAIEAKAGEPLPWASADAPAPTPKPAKKPAKSVAVVTAQPAEPPALVAKPVVAQRPASPLRTVWSRDGQADTPVKQEGRLVTTAATGAATAKPIVTQNETDPIAAQLAASPADPAEAAPAAALRSSFDTAPGACAISTASYGGSKTVLIRLASAEHTQLTALTVLDGFEKSMTDSYIKARAPGGEAIGEFADKDTAIAKAREICQAS